MALTITKTSNPVTSYGRGSDNYRRPAIYTIFKGTLAIGSIIGRPTRFMEKGAWEVNRLDATGFPRFAHETRYLSDAKDLGPDPPGGHGMKWQVKLGFLMLVAPIATFMAFNSTLFLVVGIVAYFFTAIRLINWE